MNYFKITFDSKSSDFWQNLAFYMRRRKKNTSTPPEVKSLHIFWMENELSDFDMMQPYFITSDSVMQIRVSSSND